MNESFQSLFPQRLKAARKSLGLNQEEAAQLVGVSREHWGRCERGLAMPGGEVLAALAVAGADVRLLLTGQADVRLPPDQQVLLSNYERCSSEAKQHLIQTSSLLAAGMGGASAMGSGPSIQGSVHGHVIQGNQTNHAPLTFNVGSASDPPKPRKPKSTA